MCGICIVHLPNHHFLKRCFLSTASIIRRSTACNQHFAANTHKQKKNKWKAEQKKHEKIVKPQKQGGFRAKGAL